MPQITSRCGAGGASDHVSSQPYLPVRSTACARISVLTILARSPALGISPSSTICPCIHASLSMASGSPDAGELDVGGGDVEFRRGEARKQAWNRAGRGHRDGLALEIFHVFKAALAHDAVRHDAPGATHDLGRPPAPARRDGALGAAFVA